MNTRARQRCRPVVPYVALLGLGLFAVPAGAVRFDPGQKQQDKEAMIAKLSSDINKVDHTIEVTKDLIKRSPDAHYLADLYFRLAELYVEKSRYVFARLMEMQPEGDRVLTGEKSLEVQINKKLAIETYDKVLADFPEYDNNDQIRFFKAHEFRELGDWETMSKEYKALIEKYPGSPWAIEARQILGDYHFDKGELDPAETYFQEILKLPESHMHDMARYKLAWIYINKEKFKESLAFFESAVKSGSKQRRGATGDARSLDVKRESLVAMVWPFSEVRKPYQAVPYFRSLADSKTVYVQVLKRLANRYYIKTEYVSAALLYREIVRLSADVEENIEFVQRIYDSVRNMSEKNPQRYANAAEDVDAIVKNFARFQNHLKFKPEAKEQLEKDFEIRARDLATKLHVEAQKKKDKKSAEVAAEAYRKYLSLFTNAKDRRQMQINRAEALYMAENQLAAGTQYEEIAKEMGDGNERREMLYAGIVALHKAIIEDSEYRQKHPTEEGLLNKLQLLRAREGLKQIGAFYVKSWPQDKFTPNVKYNIARMYYQQGEYERAVELFTLFVKEYPTHPDMTKAGHLALDALRKLDKYEELANLAKAFVDAPEIKDAAFKQEVAKIGEGARKRKVEFTVLSTSAGEFSEKMLAEWEKHKGTAEGEEYLYTAFVKFKGEGNIEGVFDFGGRLIGAYPDSKNLKDVLQTMGVFAIQAADFERAAFYYQEYQRRFPNDEKANELLVNAATIFTYLGAYDEAAKVLRQLRGSAPGPMRIMANEMLLKVYRDIGDWDSLARVAQTALQLSGTWLAARAYLGIAYLGIAYAQQGKDDLAEGELGQAVSLKAQSDLDKEALAQAYFEYGQIFHREFDNTQVTSAATLQDELQRKLQLLDVMDRAYVAAIGTGVGTWAIAALHESARAHSELAVFFTKVPLDGFSAAEKTAVKAELDKLAADERVKGEEAKKACATKAEQLKVFTRFGSACVTGGAPTVMGVSKRRRADVSGDQTYQQEMLNLRKQLIKRSTNTEVLTEMARRAMQVGDYHLAKLTLSRAAEIDPRSPVIQNLLGVASWHLGEPDEAYTQLDQAAKRRLNAAVINLAALFKEFGYQRLAEQTLRQGTLSDINLSSPDIHPSVGNLTSDAPAPGGT